MKRSLLISVAALACACGGSHRSDNNATAPAGSAQPGSTGAAAQTAGGDQGGATRANQTVTLVGCLVGPGQPAAPRGASAARAQARATGPETAADAAAGAASTDRFMLADAVVPGSELGGVGANGAGGSGGPLVSGRATFELDGVPPEARNSINKQVKIVGRLDARPAGAEAANGAAGAAGTSGSATAAPGASGSVPSGSSDAPGAHGTGQKSVAGHGTMGSAARSDVRNQRLVVETVQVIAENCTQR